MVKHPFLALALIAGVALSIGVRGWSLGRAAASKDPDGPVRWLATSFAAGIAAGEGETVVATRGALLVLDGRGNTLRRIWSPESEWRAAAPAAAVGVRHWAQRGAGDWAVRPLPPGTEGLAAASEGQRAWIGHSGGLTVYGPGGAVLHTSPGLGPVRVVAAGAARVWALGDRAWVSIASETLEERPLAPPAGVAPPWRAAAAGDTLYVAGTGPAGEPRVLRRSGAGWEALPRVPAAGVAVGALLAEGEGVVVAVPRDGLWRWDGRRWSRLDTPSEISGDVSALARSGSDLLAATWTGGAWRRSGSGWARLDSGGELPVPNVMGLIRFQDRLWLATFDRGLWVRERSGWRHFGRAEGLSSEEPRAFAAAGGRLLVRHTGGQVDQFDGKTWVKDALKWKVARHWTAGLSAAGLIGGWGTVTRRGPSGWEQQVLPEPLRAETITACGMAGDTLILATGKRGLWRRRGDDLRPVPGLADSWITALETEGTAVLAGTFSGEAAFWPSPEERLPVSVKLPSTVTAVRLAPGRDPLVACRAGVWRLRGGRWEALPHPELAGLEPQALFASGTGVWVGGRNGLAFLPWTAL